VSRFFEAEAFVVVVDEGSFTGAAKRLGVTKSYASKLVSRLEDRLGVRLLHRSTRALSLTEPGRTYFERCTEVMRALEEAENVATELQTKLVGKIRLTLPTTLGAYHFMGPLAELKARHPGLLLDAVFLDRHVDLLAEGFDLAIRVGDLSETSLVAQRLATAEMILCAGPAYLERRGAPRAPEDLAAHECLSYAYHELPTSWELASGERQVQIKVSGSLTTNSGQMLVEAACRGLGIIFVPVFHSASQLRDGRLVRVLPGWRRPSPVPIHAVFPAARHVPAKVRVVVQFFKDLLRTPPWAGWETPAANQGDRSS